MRKFDDLTDMDKGVYIAREEIRKAYHKIQTDAMIHQITMTNANMAFLDGLNRAIKICGECLDIATLGEIEK